MENNNNIYIMQNLPLELTLAIKNNVSDMKLQRRLNELFAEKGLSTNTVYELFNNTLDPEKLDKIETIALSMEIYKETNNEKINPNNYYSDSDIQGYNSYIPKDYDKMDLLNLKNVTKINEYEYSVYMSWELLSKIRKNRLYTHEKEIQRAPKYVTLPNGEVVLKENLNLEGVEDLKQRFKSRDIKVTTITFALLLQKGKQAKYQFDEYKPKEGMKVDEVEKTKEQFGILGDMFIKPDFNKESPNYAPFIISDGNHRFTAGCDAFEEKKLHGQKLEGGLMVSIHISDSVEEKIFVDDIFKRSDTDIEWRQSMVETDSSKCVDELIKKIDLFKDNSIARIFEEMKINKSLTYSTILKKAIDETNINLTDKVEVKFDTDAMSSIINELISHLLNRSNMFVDLKHMKESSYLLDSGMFAGYIAIAYALKDTWDVDKMINIAIKLLELNKGNEIRKMKLDQKSVNIKNVYEFFSNLVKEMK